MKPRSDADRAKFALQDHLINEMHGKLDGVIATLAGEADELAPRRPHPDAHLYDVEDQLRWKAEQLREWVNEYVVDSGK